MKKEEKSTVIAEVDDFIKHLDNGDLSIAPKASEIVVTFSTMKKSLGQTIKKEHSLAEAIAHDITSYQVLKDCICRSQKFGKSDPMLNVTLDSRLIDLAYALLGHIKRARVYGVIEDRNITDKLKESQEQNQRLKEKVDKLEKENQKLHDQLKRFGKVGFVSDVTDSKEE